MAILSARTTGKLDAAAMKGVNQVLGKSATAALSGAATRKTIRHDLAVPHDVYTLALNDFDKGLSGARRTALRYLVMSGSRAVAAAELESSPKATAPKLSHINQGSLVSASLAALESAELLPATQKDDFDLRLLQIPAIHAIALWLHGKKTDLLIPLAPDFKESTGGASVADPLTPEEFFSSLKSQADLVSGFDDSPGRSVQQTLNKSTRKSAAMKTGTRTAKKTVAKSAKKAVAKNAKKSAAKKAKKTVAKSTKKAVAKKAKKTAKKIVVKKGMKAVKTTIAKKATKSLTRPTARMARNAGVAVAPAAIASTATTIVVRPTASFRNSSREEKIRKMTTLRDECLTAAADLGVTIGQHVTVDVARTERSPVRVSVRNPAFCTLQLSVPDLDILGDELLPGFGTQAQRLANVLADSGQANGVWLR